MGHPPCPAATGVTFSQIFLVWDVDLGQKNGNLDTDVSMREEEVLADTPHLFIFTSASVLHNISHMSQ